MCIDWLLGWPLILYAVGISIICSFAFNFVQVRYFIRAWRIILFPDKNKKTAQGDMTPLQAFINTLSTNLGNGSIVGAAVAVFTGGPGAGIWVVIVGLILMSVRFVEVYASTFFGARAPKETVLGGPMLYLKEVIFGRFLSLLYAAICFSFGLVVGNAMQAHSISLSIATTWGVNSYIVAVILASFICYVVFGGAKRIVALSDAIVPIKVAVFFGATAIIIVYHWAALGAALHLMLVSAFKPTAMIGGVVGFSLMQAIRSGMNLSITSTESGLGTAAILFGYTGSSDPMRSGLMGMISTFVSSFVCFLVALCIVISGVWDSGLTSSELTIASFNTVFGQWGGWIVSFLAISFGIGVLVAYAYITRAAWLSMTGGRYENFFVLFYCAAAFVGAVVNVDVMWQAVAIINGTLLTINLFGLLWLTPRLSNHVRREIRQAK